MKPRERSSHQVLYLEDKDPTKITMNIQVKNELAEGSQYNLIWSLPQGLTGALLDRQGRLVLTFLEEGFNGDLNLKLSVKNAQGDPARGEQITRSTTLRFQGADMVSEDTTQEAKDARVIELEDVVLAIDITLTNVPEELHQPPFNLVKWEAL